MSVPSAPTISSAINTGSSIVIQWNASSGATGYIISLSPTGQTTSVSGSTLSASFPNTNSGNQLTASVVATNASGSSAAGTRSVDDIGYGMVFWVDASDTSTMTFGANRVAMGGVSYPTVTQWRDKSGRGAHMTPFGTNQAPIYVSSFPQNVMDAFFVNPRYAPVATSLYTSMPAFLKPGIVIRGRHTSATDSLAANLQSRTSPITFFTVVRDWNDGCMFGSTDYNDINVHYSTGYHTAHLYPNNASDGGNNFNSNTTWSRKNSVNNRFVINTLYHTANPNTLRFRLNGLINPKIQNVTAWANFDNLRIGRNNGETTEGILCEIIVFNRILTTTELEQVEGYLATKWGIQLNLPTTHPYYSTPYTGVPVTSATGLPEVPRTAPVLNTTPTVSLTSIPEDTTAPTGDTVAAIITSLGANYVPYDAADSKGIAIYSAPSTNGIWQVSTNSGSTWTAISSLTGSQHYLLSGVATNMIRFIPSANYNGSASLSFRAWDMTSETSGTTVSVASTGGSTIYSSGTATATIQITGMNDAPIMSGSYAFPVVNAASGTIAPISIESILSSFTITDADVSNAVAQATTGLAILYADSTLGTWHTSTDNQSSWTALSSVSASNAVHFSRTGSEYIKFVPATTTTSGTTSIQIRAWDKTNSETLVNTIGDASLGGGTTAYSANTFTLNCFVGYISESPSALVSHLVAGNILLQWTAPSDSGSSPITAYNVYRVANGVSILETTVAGLEASITNNLIPAQTYSFKVVAVNPAGESSPTETLAVYYASSPDDPSNIHIISENGQVTVSWDAPTYTGAESIESYILTDVITGNVLQTVSGTQTTTTITGLTNHQVYRILVTARNNAGLLTPAAAPISCMPYIVNSQSSSNIDTTVQTIINDPALSTHTIIGQLVDSIRTATSDATTTVHEIIKSVLTQEATTPISQSIESTVNTANTITETITNGDSIKQVAISLANVIMEDAITQVTPNTLQIKVDTLKQTILTTKTCVTTSSNLSTYTSDVVKEVVNTLLNSSLDSQITTATTLVVAYADTTMKTNVFGTLSEVDGGTTINLSNSLTNIVKQVIPVETKTAEFTTQPSLAVIIPTLSYLIDITNANLSLPIYLPMIHDIQYTIKYQTNTTQLHYLASTGKLVNQSLLIDLNSTIQIGSHSFKVIQTGTATLQYIQPGESGSGTGSGTGSGSGNGQIPCIVAGQRVRTPSGDVLIETLKDGDLILTPDNRSVPIRIYSSTIKQTTKMSAPIRIPAHTFAPSYPPNDIQLSANHAIQKSKKVWELPIHAMKRYSAIRQAPIGQSVTYYHIETPNYLKDNLIVEGSVIESLGANFMKRNGHTHTKMYTFSERLNGFTRFTPNLTKTMSK
jgi:hypothetical protein